MTRPTGEDAMSSEHVEVLERLRGSPNNCQADIAALDAAIAALSAPQPPAEAQAVATLVNRKDADGGKTTTFIRPTGLGLDLPIGEYPLHLHPPPSAPVGARTAILDALNRVHAEGRAGVESNTADIADRLAALAQQPAAFINDGNSEADFIADDAIACTACGGSGHRDDQQPAAAPTGVADRLRRVLEAVKALSAMLPDGKHREHMSTIAGQAFLALESIEQQPAAVDEAMAEIRKLARDMKLRSLDGATRSALRYSDDLREYADRLIALAAQQGGGTDE